MEGGRKKAVGYEECRTVRARTEAREAGLLFLQSFGTFFFGYIIEQFQL